MKDIRERLKEANKVDEMRKKADKERIAELEAENKDLMDAVDPAGTQAHTECSKVQVCGSDGCIDSTAVVAGIVHLFIFCCTDTENQRCSHCRAAAFAGNSHFLQLFFVCDSNKFPFLSVCSTWCNTHKVDKFIDFFLFNRDVFVLADRDSAAHNVKKFHKTFLQNQIYLI